MKVILQKDVPNLGDAGEIKEVAAGYARNYLLPRKLVIAASSGSTRVLQHQQDVIKRKTMKRNKEMSAVAENLKALDAIEIPVRVGAKNKLFGSVTSMQIATVLQEKGFSVDKRKVEMGEKVRALGAFKVKIRLADEIIVPLTLNIVADEESLAALEREKQEAEDIERFAQAQTEGGTEKAEAGEDGEIAEAGEGEEGEASAEASDVSTEEEQAEA